MMKFLILFWATLSYLLVAYFERIAFRAKLPKIDFLIQITPSQKAMNFIDDSPTNAQLFGWEIISSLNKFFH